MVLASIRAEFILVKNANQTAGLPSRVGAFNTEYPSSITPKCSHISVDIKHMDVITDARSVSVDRKFRMTKVASAERWSGTGRRYLNTNISSLHTAGSGRIGHDRASTERKAPT